MKKISCIIVLIFVAQTCLHAQNYNNEIAQYRDKYKKAFLTDDHSPLISSDTSFLKFYAPDSHYIITGKFTVTPDSKTFDMPTHSGKTKPYREYGIVTFILDNQPYILHIYQSIDLAKQDKYKDYLLLPFTDETNYKETYGGGRYIDLSVNDIKSGEIIIDFNKCYNPYCAYASGYSCPVPPKENDLKTAIKAGEKLFVKAAK